LKNEAAKQGFDSPDDKKKFKEINAFNNRMNRIQGKTAKSTDMAMRRSNQSSQFRMK
jgi:hypothetical protein